MMHLELTAEERRRVTGYTGHLTGPCCNTGDGHHQSTTDRARVTCPRCIERAAEIIREEDSVLKMHPVAFSDQRALNGRLLTMGDGSQWHHPYNGAAPLKVA